LAVNLLEINESTGVITFNNAFSFPTSDGSANQVLKTDGAGALTWQNDSSSSPTLADIATNSTSTVHQTFSLNAATDFIIEDSAGADILNIDESLGTVAYSIKSGGDFTINMISGDIVFTGDGSFDFDPDGALDLTPGGVLTMSGSSINMTGATTINSLLSVNEINSLTGTDLTLHPFNATTEKVSIASDCQVSGKLALEDGSGDDGHLTIVTNTSVTTPASNRLAVYYNSITALSTPQTKDASGNVLSLVGSDGDTGGTGSAGSGNQYVEMKVGNLTYKVLHDGTV
jgi:hypothetical protein